MASTADIIARLSRTAVSILAGHPDGMRVRELWRLILEEHPGGEQEWEEARVGKSSVRDYWGFSTTELAKAGWIRKSGDGRWLATGVGRWALEQWPDPKGFRQAYRRRYQEWARNKDRFELAEKLISLIPEKEWVSAAELAQDVGLPPETLLHWLQGERPEGWHRVLDRHGRIPPEAHAGMEEREQWLSLLEGDGIDVSQGRAEELARIPVRELRQRVFDSEEPEEDAPQRAWLVRTTGRDVRDVWIPTGTCWLGDPQLRRLTAGMTPEQIKAAVDVDLSHLDAPQRGRIAAELHAFLNRMRPGDIIVTNDRSDVYLGEIESEASSEGGLLRRRVRWHDFEHPLDFGRHLPDELSARVSNPDAGLIDLTDFVGDLLPLLGKSSQARSRTAPLPDATDELAERLLLPREWLAECVELLKERPQLIFYGPPGTGKTYLAQHLAEHLTGGRPQNVQLVQFHPAYSYEDFFEGYRPRKSEDGTVTFELVWGPLRRLAEAARARPDEPHVLIIDEINRGNLAKIFGELYFLLEYRDRGVNLLYGTDEGKTFTLPRNLVVLGTMNTADRSIALVDAAMRRRFAFMELHPSEEPVRGLLARWLHKKGLPEEPAELLGRLNDRIPDRDFKIGPSYLMTRAAATEEGLKRIWRTQILPLLEEHHYGDGTDVRGRYGLDALRGARE